MGSPRWTAATIALVAVAALTANVAIYASSAGEYFARTECPTGPGLPCHAPEGRLLLLLLTLAGLPLFVAAMVIFYRAARLTPRWHTSREHRQRATRWALGGSFPIAASVALFFVAGGGPLIAPMLALMPVRLASHTIPSLDSMAPVLLAALTLGPVIALRWPRAHFVVCSALALLAALIANLTLLPPVLILYAAVITMSGAHSFAAVVADEAEAANQRHAVKPDAARGIPLEQP